MLPLPQRRVPPSGHIVISTTTPGEYSDHLGIAAVYDAWVDARLRGRSEERAFTKDSFVSGKTLEAIADLRDQFQTLLAEAGFLAKVSRRAGRAGVYAQVT